MFKLSILIGLLLICMANSASQERPVFNYSKNKGSIPPRPTVDFKRVSEGSRPPRPTGSFQPFPEGSRPPRPTRSEPEHDSSRPPRPTGDFKRVPTSSSLIGAKNSEQSHPPRPNDHSRPIVDLKSSSRSPRPRQ
jgi:hypothetical protein